jgi:hypothetical protein
MLRTAPIRAYIPASDVSRTRKFCEQTIGLTPKEEFCRRGDLRVGRRRGLHVPDEQRRHIEGEPGVLAGCRRPPLAREWWAHLQSIG